tara:strand:- start:190136 stop:190780 length:645 start_codon:yes stop_codon:yes gene_type:complete
MASQSKWSEDPIVLLDNAVLPALWQGQTLICRALVAGDTPLTDVDVDGLKRASAMLRRGAQDLLIGRNIRPSTEQLAPLPLAADSIDQLTKTLQSALSGVLTPERAAALLTHIQEQTMPAIDAGLNAFRSIYLGHTLDQHHLQTSRAREAIEGLDRISKQIFFISINASVEAARVGDAGRGFTQISTDIRALSQSAQDATRGLSESVKEGEHAA